MGLSVVNQQSVGLSVVNQQSVGPSVCSKPTVDGYDNNKINFVATKHGKAAFRTSVSVLCSLKHLTRPVRDRDSFVIARLMSDFRICSCNRNVVSAMCTFVAVCKLA